MTKTEFESYLRRIGACKEAREWAAGKTATKAWAECPRADWLLWWAAREQTERKLLVKVACLCARTALKYVPKGEDRPLKAIHTAERWCRGKATIEEVREAAYSADAAYAATAAAYAALRRLRRHCRRLRRHSDAYAATAAAYAATAAAYAADSDAYAACAHYAASRRLRRHCRRLRRLRPRRRQKQVACAYVRYRAKAHPFYFCW